MDLPLHPQDNLVSGIDFIIQSFLLECYRNRGLYFIPSLYGYDDPFLVKEVIHRVADNYGIRINSVDESSVEFELYGNKYERDFIK